MLTSEELDQIPRHYRLILKLILKLPTPSFPGFILKRLPEIEGIFWAILVPIFLILYFWFSIWWFATATILFSFPFNLMLALIIPAVVFVFFLRIQLERTILWWKNLKGDYREWDVSKAVKEYVALMRDPKQRKTRQAA